jgi:hypothetical protein
VRSKEGKQRLELKEKRDGRLCTIVGRVKERELRYGAVEEEVGVIEIDRWRGRFMT